MTEASYVLDANVFMEAARNYYAFDLGTKFWECLERNAASGRVRSIDRVKAEIDRLHDELAEWASQRWSDAFASTDDPEVVAAFREIMIWVQAQSQFTDAAKTEFAASADGWLVAFARVHGHTVVTHEKPSADARRRVKIPNVCEAFKVPYTNTYDMLRALGAKLA